MNTQFCWNLGDTRLDQRAELIRQRLEENPAQSFPEIFSEYKELEGFYRFLNNPTLHPKRLFEPAAQQTANQLQGKSDFLILHDTTDIHPTSKATSIQEFRPIRKSKQSRGFLAHVSLAVSKDTNPQILGPLGLLTYTRGKAGKNRLAFEHRRWQQQIQATQKLVTNEHSPYPGPIHVADRGADSYSLFTQLQNANTRFVIRMTHDRRISDEKKKLFSFLKTQKAEEFRTVQLNSRKQHFSKINARIHPPRKSRQATLYISKAQVKILRTEDCPAKLYPSSLKVNVVRVFELDPPKKQKPIEWILVTSEPIDTLAQITSVVDAYHTRWVIEEFFRALKSGCRYEDRLFSHSNSWYRLLSLFIPIACKIYNLKTQSESSEPGQILPFGDLSESVLQPVQWKILRALAKKHSRELLSLQDAKREIASLGGHIPYSGPPGWIVLTRGFFKLLQMSKGSALTRAAISD